jgi:hypothetical protein
MREIIKTMTKYQNYRHYNLPVTMDPLKYGKLIVSIETLNLFVIQVNKTNIALITQFENLNKIKFFKEGELVFEFTDLKTGKSETSFIRSLNNKKFTFTKSELTSIERILNRDIINPLFFLTFHQAILKNKQYNTTKIYKT